LRCDGQTPQSFDAKKLCKVIRFNNYRNSLTTVKSYVENEVALFVLSRTGVYATAVHDVTIIDTLQLVNSSINLTISEYPSTEMKQKM